MVKLTKRKGFNFFRSYFDVYNELEGDDKIAFMDALLDRQFLGIKPNNLKGMAKFAYISQTNSIDSQVKGYEDKTGTKLHPTVGVNEKDLTPIEQVQEEVQVQVQEKEKVEVQVQEKQTLSEILEIFNSLCIKLPKVKKLSPAREKLLKARIKEHGLEEIGNVFKIVSSNSFLNGDNSNGWKASFDWILNTNNFLKILEGNYNKEKKGHEQTNNEIFVEAMESETAKQFRFK